MLRQETNETIPPTAAQARVTPEELAAALSRIEARKDAGQRQVDGTIPIGEAVQQLGIDTTPEEVLAEVQAIRQEPMRTKKRQPSIAQRLVLSLGLSGILLGIALDVNGLRQMRSHQSAKPVSLSSTPQPSNAPKSISLDPNLMVQDTSDKLVMLSEVGDNQPVRCNYSDGSFQSSYGGLSSWILIKHDGQVYVRAWIPHISKQAIQNNGADVSTWESDLLASDPSHTSHVPITLPLNGFQVTPSDGDDEVSKNEEFHAVNIHLDKHAYEKWQP